MIKRCLSDPPRTTSCIIIVILIISIALISSIALIISTIAIIKSISVIIIITISISIYISCNSSQSATPKAKPCEQPRLSTRKSFTIGSSIYGSIQLKYSVSSLELVPAPFSRRVANRWPPFVPLNILSLRQCAVKGRPRTV